MHPQLQLPFRVTHLIVSPSCAAHFDVEDIRVGCYSQYINASPIAADLFAVGDVLHGEVDERGFYAVKIGRGVEALLPLRIDMPTCQVGQDIIVTVTNVDPGEHHEFRGALLGKIDRYYRLRSLAGAGDVSRSGGSRGAPRGRPGAAGPTSPESAAAGSGSDPR